MDATTASANQLARFAPQGILLFCCITRKVFLREYALTDARPFGILAPSCGFYTYGEISRLKHHVNTLNSVLLGVGFREKAKADDYHKHQSEFVSADLNGHMSVMQRLVHFVEATTADLEEANRFLKDLAIHAVNRFV